MRRVRVETGIYLSERANGSVYEIGWHDKSGKQRWMTVGQDIEEARRLRVEFKINSVGGASKYKKMRKDLFEIADVADRHPFPSRRQIIAAIKATSNSYPRKAWLKLAGLALAQARRYESPTPLESVETAP